MDNLDLKYFWAYISYCILYAKDYALYICRRIKYDIYATFGTLNFLSILWNFFLVLLAELIYLLDAVWAVLYLISITIGYKLLIMFPLLYLYDISMEYFRKKAGLKPANPYALTALDRGIAFCAGIWPISEAFMFFQEIARSYPFTNYLNHNYFRGLVVMLSAAPLTSIILAFVVYGQIVRRIGPDTRWFGGRPKRWIKYQIRYHWCFSLCLHAVITLWIFCFLKFAVANGLKGDEQEVWASSFFFMFIGLSAYQMLCAIIGVKPRFPIFHRACVFNCGRQKGSKDDRPDRFPNAPDQ